MDDKKLKELSGPATRPCFFFSYSHKNQNEYLECFFEDLCNEVADRSRLSRETGEVSFKDLKHTKPGQDWDRRIAETLENSYCFVCVYTPKYFDSSYCGKEFWIALKRDPGVEIDETGAARDTAHIIPILWVKESDLSLEQLPPRIAHYISYVVTTHSQRYRELGLRRIIINPGRKSALYLDILDEIASRLLELRKQGGLDPWHVRPELTSSEVENAFSRDRITAVRAAGPAVGGLNSVILFFLVPEIERLPAGGGSTRLLEDLGRETLPSGFRVRTDTFELDGRTSIDRLLAALQVATERNEVSVMILDPDARLRDHWLESLREIIDDPTWRGAILVPSSDNGDRPAFEIPHHRSQELVSREFFGAEDFQAELNAVVIKLRGFIMRAGDVGRPATGEGWEKRPGVRGPGR